MFFFLSFLSLPGILSVRAILPVSPLEDCPNISPPADVTLDKITGSWRLGYLFIDENDDLEEDNTCAVAEIMQVNETRLEFLLFVDGRRDEFTIDRYTKEFDVTVISPTEWIIHTTFASLEFINAKVISATRNHLILTFCVNPFKPESTTPPDTVNDYDSFMDRDSLDDIFKAQKYTKLLRHAGGLNELLDLRRRVRRPSRLLRGKRHAEESSYEKLLKYLRDGKSEPKAKKHLWTAILVKDNNVSALRFVENASLLLKYGFKITEGQLVSFGSCSLTKK